MDRFPSFSVIVAGHALRLLSAFMLTLMLCAPVAAQSNPLLITHGSREHPRIALTFDLCQVPTRPAGFDRGVFNVLKQTATPATFFVGGDWLRTHPREGTALASVPFFELGDHSWDHPDLRKLDDTAIRSEITRTETLLQHRFGKTPHLFRLPFGYYDSRVLKTVAATGMRIIQWDVVSGDPDRHLTAPRLIRGVTSQARNGSIVIMHANGRGWHTAEALPEIIRKLHKRGFELVTVSALLDQDRESN